MVNSRAIAASFSYSCLCRKAFERQRCGRCNVTSLRWIHIVLNQTLLYKHDTSQYPFIHPVGIDDIVGLGGTRTKDLELGCTSVPLRLRYTGIINLHTKSFKSWKRDTRDSSVSYLLHSTHKSLRRLLDTNRRHPFELCIVISLNLKPPPDVLVWVWVWNTCDMVENIHIPDLPILMKNSL